jgi:cephalosporin hydroxylase
MNLFEQFDEQVKNNIIALGADNNLYKTTMSWIRQSNAHGYTYNYSWFSRPIIQYPQDIMALQEIIWKVRPDLIIETGIAHGGSLIFYASLLSILDYCDAVSTGTVLNPLLSKRRVLGIDIDIRQHNRAAIEAHPMAHKIEMIQGSSIATEVITEVHERAKYYKRILVCFDSNHTHDHVLAELTAYASLVSVGSYCCVFDTLIEDMPAEMFPDRPWGPGNNPKTAVHEFLQTHSEFEIDISIQKKLLITVAPDGYLYRLK